MAFAALLAATPAPGAERDAATRALHALFEEAWQRDLREDPLTATYLGDHRYDRLWPERSPGSFERRRAADAATLQALAGIDRARLGAEDRLSHELFEREYRSRLAAQPFKPWLYEVLGREGVHTLSELAELLPFASVQDYDNWIARLAGIDRYLEQNRELLELGLREGRTQPRAILERAAVPLAALAAGPAEASPFYEPFGRMPATIPAAERERLQAQALRVIEDTVIPAYRRFERYFRTACLPKARTSVGIWDTPDGAAYYRNRVAFHTTTDLTPEGIHHMGLREVARIRAEMDRIIAQVGFQGDFQEFLAYLRTDARFYYGSPEELLQAYTIMAKRIDPELVKLFGKLPRTPYGVRPIPMTSAPRTTTAYYQGPAIDGSRAGYYYVNLYRPEVRPRYEIEVLTAHEAVPGHHLQIALAMEQTGLPQFRRNADFTAYVEGWALYTESLGEQLGLYRDPYSKFGQLTYDMWRAVRLVVDTGLHDRRWTREQAIEYFKANAAKTETDIVNEIDRYIAWPGQALAYKIGQLRILELRDAARSRLGSRFDIREFHDAVLATGPMPLDLLSEQIHFWIETTVKRSH